MEVVVVQAEPGRLIGDRYLLINQLASGGFGRVWEAQDQILHVSVAVKEVLLSDSDSDAKRWELVVRAEREARHAARLRDHPNIVAVHDVVIEDGVPWMVMRLVAGCSLADRLKRHGPLPVEDTARVARALLRALSAAHGAGIVHRDIKPGNVMLASDGGVLLADFGIAVGQADTNLTASGAIIGSWGYAAPERIRGEDRGSLGDLFSLGATLYQAVEGEAPFSRSVPTAVVFEQAPPMRRAGRLAKLILWLLEKDPDRRPTITQALNLIGADLDGPPSRGDAADPEAASVAEEALLRRAAAALVTAERIARAVTTEDTGRAWVLAAVAHALAATNPERAGELAGEAERIARTITESRKREWAMITVAQALAATSPERAGELVGEAELAARGCTDDNERAIALAEVASAAAAIDPERAERIARTITEDSSKAWALAIVAQALAATNPERAGELVGEAERIARMLAEHVETDLSLTDIGTAVAATDPERAERIAHMLTDDRKRISALTDVVWVAASCCRRPGYQVPLDALDPVFHFLSPTGRVE